MTWRVTKMSNYFIECCKDHLEGMKAREKSLERDAIIITAKLNILRLERENLEKGIINWIEEELS